MDRKWVAQIAGLMAMAAIPAGLAAWTHPRRPAWNSDEVQVAVAEDLRDRVLWVDARPPAEYELAHIPGAIALHEETWDEELGALLDVWTPEKVVVVYCSTLSCQTSHDVAKRLREEVALKDVRVLAGGWESWFKAHP